MSWRDIGNYETFPCSPVTASNVWSIINPPSALEIVLQEAPFGRAKAHSFTNRWHPHWQIAFEHLQRFDSEHCVEFAVDGVKMWDAMFLLAEIILIRIP